MTQGTDRSKVGVRYGGSMTVVHTWGEVQADGKIYRLVDEVNGEGKLYRSLRIYNDKGHFIKRASWLPRTTESIKVLLDISIQ